VFGGVHFAKGTAVPATSVGDLKYQGIGFGGGAKQGLIVFYGEGSSEHRHLSIECKTKEIKGKGKVVRY
jgi:hypothetical protein